jgi:hypothetical protein
VLGYASGDAGWSGLGVEERQKGKKDSVNLSEKALRSSVKRMDAPAGTLAGAGLAGMLARTVVGRVEMLEKPNGIPVYCFSNSGIKMALGTHLRP